VAKIQLFFLLGVVMCRLVLRIAKTDGTFTTGYEKIDLALAGGRIPPPVVFLN
jgi:hypothetical protein